MKTRPWSFLAALAAVAAGLACSPVLAQDGRIINFASRPNPSGLNQQVHIHAEINWADIKPSGTLTYYSNGAVIPGCQDVPWQLNGPDQDCLARFNAAGTYSLTVSYSGDSTYPASTSAPISHVVDASTQDYPVFSAGSLQDTTNPRLVDITLAVSGGDTLPTGTVDFLDGIITKCAAVALTASTVSNTAVATCSVPLSNGMHHFTMQYSGDALYHGGTYHLDTGGFLPARLMDFDGDGNEDQVLLGVDGSVTVWLMQGVDIKSQYVVASGARPGTTHAGDFNGDGMADIVQELADGTTWIFQSPSSSGTSYFLRDGASGWHVTHAADFDGDGKADLLWRNDNGAVELWLMNGGTASATVQLMPPGTPWRVQLLGDFNGDQRTDLVWRNTADGSTGAWLMDGTRVLEHKTVMPAGTGWTATLVAELDGDGMADLLWTHADGTVGAWLMNGTTAVQHRTLMGAGTGWSLSQASLMNTWSERYLIWTHTSGQTGEWLMNGLDIGSRQTLMPPGTGWHFTTSGKGSTRLGTITWTHDNGSVGMWEVQVLYIGQKKTELPPGTPYTVISQDVRIKTAP